MAAPTYSLSLTGYGAHNPFAVKNLTVPDISAGSISSGPSFSGAAGVMQDGDQLLCKGPDGALRWYRIDAERSTPGNIILLRV